MKGGALWALTTYFNPMGYRRRLANYRRFRAGLPDDLPLAAIELGFAGRWELTPADAELYVRVGGGDVMWQKERLLNLLLRRLPPECEFVVWIDSDLLLPGADWPGRVAAALGQAPLVQPFTSLLFLGPDPDSSVNLIRVDSLLARVHGGQAPEAALGNITDRARSPAGGMVWAARYELMARHGFFDASIIGGGDTALACAALGVPEVALRVHAMNPMQRAYYLAWATPFQRELQAGVGLVSGEVRHCWHGELADRRSGQRHVDLASHQFDPGADIVQGEEGAWRWGSHKPALHAYVREYFRARNEDGPPQR